MGTRYLKNYFPIPEENNTKVREIPKNEDADLERQIGISMSGDTTIMYFEDDIGQVFRVVFHPNHNELWNFFKLQKEKKCEFRITDLQKVVKMEEY